MTAEGFRIHLLSNGSESFFPKNTLTQFSNYVPSQNFLNDKWMVALKAIGFHFNTISVVVMLRLIKRA